MRAIALAVALATALASCAEKEETLEGERIDIRTPVGATGTPGSNTPVRVPALRLPRERAVAAWTHRMGGPDHQTDNAALRTTPAQVWSADIGEGQSRRARITADPVSDGTRIYTIDAEELLVATSFDGSRVWSHDLTPPGEGAGSTTGAGLAVARGTVYATSAFGVLTALDAATGAVRWTQALGAVPSGPPTVADGLVYLVTRDNRGWAIDADTGRVRWQLSAAQVIEGFGSGASPAVGRNYAVFPFSSGELVGTLRRGGVQIWSGAVSGQRLGKVYAGISDITADPVIAGGQLYTGTQAGRLVALELNTGQRLWTADTGVLGPILAAGNALWIVSDEGRLQRLNPSNGDILWSRPLPYFTEDKPKKYKGIHVHYGPILAASRLWLASSDSRLRSFDPATGQPLGEIQLPAPASAAPIVVRGTLFIVTTKGDLLAFR